MYYFNCNNYYLIKVSIDMTAIVIIKLKTVSLNHFWLFTPEFLIGILQRDVDWLYKLLEKFDKMYIQFIYIYKYTIEDQIIYRSCFVYFYFSYEYCQTTVIHM